MKINNYKSLMYLDLTRVFKFSLSLIIWSLLSINIHAQLVNVPVTGFNNDIVANGIGITNTVSSGTIPGVTQPTIGVDGNGPSAYTFVDNTYKWYSGTAAFPTCGLPATNLIPSSLTPGLTYSLQSYSGNNSMTIASNTYTGSVWPTTGAVILSTPTSYTKLYVLYESVLNTVGPSITATVTFTDASTQVFSGNALVNWFTNTGTTYSNMTRAQNAAPGLVGACGSGPYLFEMQLPLSLANYSKLVQSISFSWSAPTGSAVNSVDYFHTMAVGGLTPCAMPSAQPTLPSLTTISTGQINGSFTAATGTPSGYLVVRYPAGSLETLPSNGVTYSPFQTIGLGTVVQASASTTFNSTGLNGGTSYDYYAYSYNSGATCGGPTYLTTSGFIGNQTTSPCGSISGIIPIGPGLPNTPAGGYTNLTLALADITSIGLAGPTFLELQTGYTTAYAAANEVYPISFPSNPCITALNPLTIRPALGVGAAILLTSTNATASVIFNGASYVTIDGQPGGLGGVSFLSIANTAVSASAAIQFINDASNNTVKYCTVTSRNNSATSGTIAFSTGTILGNDANTIDNCSITDDASGSFPVNGIYSAGTSAAIDNSGNIVSNCKISNYFSATLLSSGILLTGTGNTAWSITDNRLYQTANRIYTVAQTHNGIAVLSGSGYTINNNIIGFANAIGTGTTNLIGNSVALTGTFPSAYTVTGTANATRYIAINCAFTAAGIVSNIQNNTIAGFALYTSSGATTTNGIWCGINVTSGNVNIGSATGNTIGVTSGASSIYAACTTTGGQIVGIYTSSANTVSIQNNSIGGIDASGTSATISGGITGIDIAGAGNFAVSNNNIGNNSTANLRIGYMVSGSNLSNVGTHTSTTGATALLVGIRSAITGNSLTINGNTLRGWATSSTVSAITGITSSGTMTGTTPSAIINGNFLGTSGLGWVNYVFANSGALTGISLTNTIATTHSIQTNDFRGITYSVAGTNAHTYINITGATAAGNTATISSNTFTNLNVNTTGSVTFISHNYVVAANGTQSINGNSIVTAFNKLGAGGTVLISTTNSTSAAGSLLNQNNNNFSNITVTGATTLTGFNNTDGTTGTIKTVTGNIFNNWIGGTSAITGMIYNYHNGVSSISTNTITNITGQSTITAISIAASNNTANPLTVGSNTITGLSSTGTGGNVTGITCANTSPLINISSNIISSLSSTGASSAIVGIAVTGATITNVNDNRITGITGTGTTAPTANGILVSGGATVNLNRNKICDVAENGIFTTTTPSVIGISLTGGTTVTAFSNIIGDLRTPATSNADAIRGISVTSATATTSYNLYNNTIYLAASSTGTVFGTTGIYHAANATATTAKLDLRNNIVVNNSSNVGVGITSALRRSVSATLGNYATTSNNNMYYAGVPSAVNAIMNDNGTVYGTAAAAFAFGPVGTAGTFQNFVTASRESASFTEVVSNTPGVYFQSTTCSSSNFLHIVNGLSTQVESGGISPNVVTFETDYDGDIRAGSAGYLGLGTAPDVGADEFDGITPAPAISAVTVTPGGNQCTAVGHDVSSTIITLSGTITGATLNFTFNGIVQAPVVMTNPGGNSWTGTIPASAPGNATVAWSIVATNSSLLSTTYVGQSYKDEPLTGIGAIATTTASLICAGTSVTLAASLSNPVTAAIGAGATTSATYPNPIYSNWANNKMQILYLPSELTAAGFTAGSFSSMSLALTATNTTARNGFTIQMANVGATVLTTTFLTPSFTQVYTANYVPFVGANVFAFGTGAGSSAAFNWDGVSSVVIQICWDNTASTLTLSSTCTADNTSFNSVVSYNRTSTTGISTCGITVTGSLVYTVRPRLTFVANAAPAITGYLWNDGSTTSSITVAPLVSTNYNCAISALGCTSVTNTIPLTVNQLPAAPTATPSSQCGIGIPAASVASASGLVDPQFYWYSAPSAGTLLQTPPLGNTLVPFYSNDFSSATLTNSSIAGAASIGAGALALQPTTTGTGGALTVNPNGLNSNIFQTDFDFAVTATGASIADGFSYCIGDDVLPLNNGTTPSAEHGSGSKIRICFMTYNAASGSDGKGIYLGYGVSATTGFTAATPGMLGYSTNLSWLPVSATTVNSHVTVSINAAGQLTLTVAGFTIFNNVQLPAGYLSANHSNWKHIFSSRSGGVAGGFGMDNLVMQANGYAAGYTTYQTPINTPTTFYVIEKDPTTGCESSPRTPLLANVTFGDAVTPVAQISNLNITQLCIGNTFQLSTSQSGANLNNYDYTWTASSTNSGITGSVSGGSFASPTTLDVTPLAPGTYIYTVNYTDGVCSGVNTISITVNPPPIITSAIASPSQVCSGSSATLTGVSINAAPGTATVGAGSTTTSTYNAPFYSLWSNKHEQILITAAELTAAGLVNGNITSLSFPTTAGTVSNKDYTIKMLATSATNVSAFVTGSFTTVYTAVAQAQTAGTNNTIALTTPFNWDGTSNIVIELCWGDNTTTATLSSTSPADATSFVSVRVEYNTVNTGGSTICSSVGSSTVSYSVRPRILIGGQVGANVTGSLNWTWNPGALNTNPATINPVNVTALPVTTAYTVTATNPVTGCSADYSPVNVTVNPLPAAPTATPSTQCGVGIPAASVTSTSGLVGPQFYWYSAPSAGTLLQSPPLGITLVPFYSNDFSSSTLINSSISGAASIGAGSLALQPTATGTGGALTVNPNGLNSNIYQTDFDFAVTATGASIADGFSYCIGDDVLPLNNSSTPTAEHGSGSKIRICFMTYNAANGSDGMGIYLGYGVSATTGFTASTPGMLGYSTDVSWKPTSATSLNSHVTVSIDAAGQLTLIVGGITIFNNVQLPAGYLNANHSTWKHIFSSRSGGVAGGFGMDNLIIQSNGFGTGYSTYQTSINTPTTFYVVEKDPTTGCESSPRTSLLANVTYGDTVVPVAQISNTNITALCVGNTFQLSTAQTGILNNTYTYSWTASSSNSGISGSVSGGTFGSPVTVNVTPLAAGTYIYTLNYTDGNCAGVNTISISINPLPIITSAVASPTELCSGGPTTLTAISINAAAGTATVGAGSTSTSTYNAPFYSLWSNKHEQILITAAELTAAGLVQGNITSLSFPTTAGTVSNKDYTIKMISTNATNVSAFVTGSFTTVYSTTAQPQTANTNNTIALTTPFNWDGSSNIVIELCWGDNTTTATLSSTSPADATSYVSVRVEYNQAITSGSSVCNSGALNLTYSVRPKILIGGQVGANVTNSLNWVWNPGALNVNPAVSNPINLSAAPITISYSVTATNPVNGCSASYTPVDVIVNPIPAAPTTIPSSQCGYGIPTASVTSTSGIVSPLFNWYSAQTGGTLLQSSTSQTYLNPINLTTTFYVSESGFGGCESSPRTAVVANVSQPDTITITSPVASCVGSPVSLSVSQTGVTNSYVYTWSAIPSVGSGVIGSPTGASQSFTPTVSGSYVYTVLGYDALNNCTAIDTQKVLVYIGLTGTVSSTQITSCTNPTGLITANVSGAGTVVNNDFSSPILPSNMTSAGNGFAITGGQMQLTPAINAYSGGVLISNPTGLANNDFQIDFDMITTTAAVSNSPADGFSYSYGDDVVALPTGTAATGTTGVTTLAPENGSGTKLKLAFDAINNTGGCTAGTPGTPASISSGNVTGVYLMYNSTTSHQGATCPGVIYFDGGPSIPTYTNYIAGPNGTAAGTGWRATTAPGATTHVTIKINALGQVSLWLNGVQVVFNQQLPASYLTADKSTWKHAFCARTGGLNQGHFIDNLLIQYNNFYEYSINGGGSWTTTNPITPPGPGTYSVDARYVAVPACATNLGSVTINTPVFTTVSTSNNSCLYSSSQPTLSFTPAFGGATFQWDSSAAGANVWAPIAGATSATYTLPQGVYLNNTDFRCNILCAGVPTAGSPSSEQTILVYSPIVTNPTPGTRCGVGTVDLGASTPSVGATLRWYAASTGGTVLGTGSPFTTPIISGSTTYYVAAEIGSGSSGTGLFGTGTSTNTNTGYPAPLGTYYGGARHQMLILASELSAQGLSAGSLITGLNFDVTATNSANPMQDYTINMKGTSAVALSSTFETGLTEVFAPSSIAAVAGLNTFSFNTSNFIWNGSDNIVVETIYNNNDLGTSTNGNCSVKYTTTGFTSVNYSRVDNGGAGLGPIYALSSFATSSDRPNIQLVFSGGCPSPRTAVVATVTPAPVVTVSPSSTICESDSILLTAVCLANPTYGYTWNPGGFSGANYKVAPSVTTTYTVTALDISGGANNNCQDIQTVTITVNQRPTVSSLTSSPSVLCQGDTAQISLTAVPFIPPSGNYTVASIAFAPVSGTMPNAGPVAGDEANVNASLGFNFNYYGTTYTDVTIHANGQILMGANNTTANSVYSPSVIPTAAAPNNWVGVWSDLNLSGSDVTWGIVGVAPYRQLVVNFTNVNYFSATPFITFQTVLNETYNTIDVHMVSTNGTVGNTRAIGIENSTGTLGTAAPARNGGTWSATNESWKFSPPVNSSLTYAWSPATALTSTSISNPKAAPNSNAVYTVTISETGTGCSISASLALNVTPKPIPYVTPGNDTIVCSSSIGYYIHVKDAGPYAISGYPSGTMFEWVNYTPPTPGLDSIFVNISDNYTCIVYLPGSLGGCSKQSDTVFVDFGTAQSPLPYMQQDSVKCHGGSNGAAIAELVSGYVPNINYKWYNSANVLVRNVTTNIGSDTLKNVPIGWYYLYVYNGLGSPQISCVAIDSIEVFQLDPVTVSGVISDVTCYNTNTGSIQLTPGGGTDPYTYLWNNGSTVQNRNNLKKGTYFVTVFDHYGCTATGSYTINQPNKLLINLNVTTVKCGNGSNGKVTANPIGGTTPYTYLWNNGQTGNIISNLTAGTYTVSVTDAHNCVATTSVTVTQNPPLVVIAAPGPGNTASASVSGGVGPYVYFWSTLPAQTTATATGLTPCTTYKVKVTDSKGCSKISSVTIPCPKGSIGDVTVEPTVSVFPNPTTGMITINAANFDGQKVTLRMLDGLGQLVIDKQLELVNNSTILDLANLPKGIYMLNVMNGGKFKTIKVVLQ